MGRTFPFPEQLLPFQYLLNKSCQKRSLSYIGKYHKHDNGLKKRSFFLSSSSSSSSCLYPSSFYRLRVQQSLLPIGQYYSTTSFLKYNSIKNKKDSNITKQEQFINSSKSNVLSSALQNIVQAYQHRMLWLVYPKLSPSMTYGKVHWKVSNYSTIECYDLLFQVETADLVQIQNKENPDDVYRMDIESQEDGLLFIYPQTDLSSNIQVGTPIGIILEDLEISTAENTNENKVDRKIKNESNESLSKYLSLSMSDLKDAFNQIIIKSDTKDETKMYEEEEKAFYRQLFTPPLQNFYDESKLVELREKQNIRIAMWQAYS